jgi:hypothetical protein
MGWSLHVCHNRSLVLAMEPLAFYPRFQTARCGPFWTNLFNALDLIQGNADGWPLGWNDTASSAVVPVIGLLSVGPLGAK